jgi:DNA-binding transcriptional ArsR family regulator
MTKARDAIREEIAQLEERLRALKEAEALVAGRTKPAERRPRLAMAEAANRMLEFLAANAAADTVEISEATGLANSTVSRAGRRLADEGKLVITKVGKRHVYDPEVKPAAEKPKAKPARQPHPRAKSVHETRTAVRRGVNEAGPEGITAPALAAKLGLSEPTVRTHLADAFDEGAVNRSGNGKPHAPYRWTSPERLREAVTRPGEGSREGRLLT